MTETEQRGRGTSWAEELVREVHPAAVVVEVVARTGGQLSAVYEVRCAERAHDVVLKVYAAEWGWKQAKEVAVYGRIAKLTSLPVPDVLHEVADRGPDGRAVTVLSLVRGRPLSEVAAADAGLVPAMYRQMGALLAELHQVGEEAFGYLTTRVLDPLPDNGEYMRRQFGKKVREFEELGGDRTLADAVARRVERDGGLFERCRGPVLCHNDLHEGNVLVVEEAGGWRVSGVIDVENAIAADPLIDLAKTDYYAVGRGQPERAALLEGYGDLPEDAAERLDSYRLYHALELWDWFRSVGTMEPLAGIAEDIARLAGA